MGPLLFVSIFFRPTVGGSIRWIEQLCLDYRGEKVSVLTKDIGPVEEEEDSPIRIRRVPLRTVFWLRPESLLLYRKLCSAAGHVARKERPALVVAARVVPEGLVALHLNRLLGIPFVVLAHGEEVSIPMRARRRWVTRFLKLRAMKHVFRSANCIIANSRNTADVVRSFAGSKVRTRVLHPGTDPELFRPEGDDLREELGLGGRPVLLTIGHLKDRKGQSQVIRALPRILERFPDAIYLMSGIGVDEANIRRLVAECGVEHAVRYLGRISEDKLPALYRTADLFILANRNLADGDFEGFGIVYLEAGASGLPVIVGARTGNADAVVDGVTALRVDPENLDEVAETVVRVLGDRELAGQLGRAGRDFVVESFSPAHLADQWNEILGGVLRESE